ncbi:MIND complex subunit [Saccharomyces cerevisiae]|nr:MIND complex subunit [Saccharomyces cerevisiae]
MVNSHGIRYIRLKQVFNRALDQSISKLQSWDKVSSCFPQYVNSKQGAINVANCQRQLTEFWTELCQREFKEIMEERNVEQKLNELDELILEAKERYTDRDQDEVNKGPRSMSSPAKSLWNVIYTANGCMPYTR